MLRAGWDQVNCSVRPPSPSVADRRIEATAGTGTGASVMALGRDAADGDRYHLSAWPVGVAKWG